MSKEMNQNYVLIAFIISLIASLGSLFFSEILHFVPCSMCWYQRIFMYPLVLIFLMGLLYPDDTTFKYSIPLVLIGLGLSIYHNLLMLKIIPESIVPCTQGVPCSTIYINYFGFITIPFLSFTAYLCIFLILIISQRK
jgi:disulfide bond formation protein DsbB